MDQDNWLDIDPAIEPAALEPDYLSLDTPSIEVPRADAPYKDIRFQVMAGTERVWACNGRYVACRPAGFNPTTKQRHARFLSSRHYTHIGTFDDVQVFKLEPGSPFYRTEGDVRAGTWYEVLRAAAQAAVARDWRAYVDLLEEIATRLKSTPTGTESGDIDVGLARQRFMDTIEYLESLIFMRWYANQAIKDDEAAGLAMSRMRAEIDAGVANVRAARGAPPSRRIATAGPMRIR